jgi:hypothetical protein
MGYVSYRQEKMNKRIAKAAIDKKRPHGHNSGRPWRRAFSAFVTTAETRKRGLKITPDRTTYFS